MTSPRDIAAIRFGYGYRPSEATPPDGPDALLRSLASGNPRPATFAKMTSAPRLRFLRDLRMLFAADPNAMTDREDRRRSVREEIQDWYTRDAHAKIVQSVLSPQGFYERLAVFWANHFTVSVKRPKVIGLAGPFEAEAVRPNIMGHFAEMLTAVVFHPAMLIYLDQVQSIGPNSNAAHNRGKGGLNENLAREILELHTLGVDGGYQQADVIEFARILTGLNVNLNEGRFEFRPAIAEPGPFSLFGHRYADTGDKAELIRRVLWDIARHPATARFIATKLARHFSEDDPPPGLVAALEKTFLETEGSLPALYKTLVERPEPWNSFGRKAKTPYDFLISGLRATGAEANAITHFTGPGGRPRYNPLTVGALVRFDQQVFGALGPDGFPDTADAWIHPQGLSRRIEWARGVAKQLVRESPTIFLRAALPETAMDDTIFAVENAMDRDEGIVIALASPEFNRR